MSIIVSNVIPLLHLNSSKMSDPRLIDMEPGGESTQYGLNKDHLLQVLFANIQGVGTSLSANSL